MPPITLEAPSHTLRPVLADWLAGLSLDPPRPLSLALRGDATETAADTRPVFRQPEVDIVAGAPSHDVTIRWRLAPGFAHLARHAREATVVLPGPADPDPILLTRSLLTAVLVFLLRRAGWHHIHAAAVRDPAGRGWLLAGDSRCGKSTTAALLAAHGWQIGGDDLVFLAPAAAGVDVVAARAPLRLREGGLALLARTAHRMERGKAVFTPEDLGGSWVSRIRPEGVLFPRVAGGVTALRAMPAADAFAALVRWSAWVALEPDYADEHLGLLHTLAMQAPGQVLDLGPDVSDRLPALLA